MDKQRIRERIWDEIEDTGVARFPFPPHGRIPNFDGAGAAAERLAQTDEWDTATSLKSNPDAPQLPVRRAALRAGKTVYIAVPRLADEQPFIRLDPAEIDDLDRAATIGGSAELGTPVALEELDEIDLIVSGSVAVSPDGTRIGKGEGYSDLEFALLREVGLVDDGTPTVTTVHERQVVDGELPSGSHDVSMDVVVTPGRVIRTGASGSPAGIQWDALSEEQIAEIPVLRERRP